MANFQLSMLCLAITLVIYFLNKRLYRRFRKLPLMPLVLTPTLLVMLLVFVPAVVAVVNYAQLLLVDGWRIFAVIALSTVMVLGTTAWVVEKVYRYEMRRLNRG